MEKVKPVKTAVVGCGMISNIYIRNLKNLFQIVDLAAVCDLHTEAAEEKARIYGVPQVMTMEEIERSEEIELVVNLTGPEAHYEVIRKMLLAGKHVFTEKTLTTELEEARELIKLAEEKNLYLGAAPDTILGAGIQTAKKVIDAGMIGKVTSCIATVNRNHALNSELFGFIRKSKAAAFPYDVGVYYVAALLALLGPVREVSGFTANPTVHEQQILFKDAEEEMWTMPGRDVLAGTMLFENGIVGSIHFNGNSINEEQQQIRIYGTEGILELGDPNTFGGDVKLIRAESGECTIPHTHGYDGRPILENPTTFEEMYGHRGVGAAEMAWAIRMHRRNRCSKEFAFHTLEVLKGMEQSAKEKRVYQLTSTFEMSPLKSGYMSTVFHGSQRGDAERSLID